MQDNKASRATFKSIQRETAMTRRMTRVSVASTWFAFAFAMSKIPALLTRLFAPVYEVHPFEVIRSPLPAPPRQGYWTSKGELPRSEILEPSSCCFSSSRASSGVASGGTEAKTT